MTANIAAPTVKFTTNNNPISLCASNSHGIIAL